MELCGAVVSIISIVTILQAGVPKESWFNSDRVEGYFGCPKHLD